MALHPGPDCSHSAIEYVWSGPPPPAGTFVRVQAAFTSVDNDPHSLPDAYVYYNGQRKFWGLTGSQPISYDGYIYNIQTNDRIRIAVGCGLDTDDTHDSVQVDAVISRVCGAPTCDVLDANLVAHWPPNETGTSNYQDVVGGDTGVAQSANVVGHGDYVEFPDATSNDLIFFSAVNLPQGKFPVTYCLWAAQLTTLSDGYHDMFDYGQHNLDRNYFLGRHQSVGTNYFAAGLWGDEFDALGGDDNAWHWYCGTFDGTTYRSYMDAQLMATGVPGTGPDVLVDSVGL